ncbi:MAG TPA: VWA domain-containing protein [Vicinamibacterales bacterium]|nr:VWA domain-containing protein [Vicinamibacterales bacterium]
MTGQPRLAVVSAALFVSLPFSAYTQRGAAPPAPKQAPQPVAREMAVEYRQLIDRYLAGDQDAAIGIVKTWQVASVEAVQEVQPWDRATLRAAAMLETDAALARASEAIRKFGWPVPMSRATLDTASRLTLALRWLDLADNVRPSDKSPFRRQWQIAVGRRLLWDGFVTLADAILGDASLLFDSDPDVLLAYGTLRESAALRLTANLGRVAGTASGLFAEQMNRAVLLDDARRSLRRALGAAPKSDEARLRLAHVRIWQRDDRAARTLLEELRSSRPSMDVAYLAGLMLGGIRMRQNDPSGAAMLFQEARQLMPDAQSAYIAQAQALRAAGQFRESAEALDQMLSRATRGRDPWARYPIGLDETRTSLEALRDEVKQRRPAVAASRPPNPVGVASPGATFDWSQPADPADRVVLDVLVTKDHRPVSGLTAADFDVRHDDERPRVEVTEIQSMPLDVRITIDVGNGLEGDRTARVKEAARALVERLRPADRAEVLTFSEDMLLTAGLTSDRTQLNTAIDRLTPASGAALFDAAFVSLALPVSPSRRTLALIFTAGLDTSSWLAPTTVVEAAAASPVTVYGVIVPEPDLPLRQQQLDVSRVRKWLFQDPALLRNTFLAVLADDTGGEILNAATNADLAATFSDVLSRFQQRYRLTYTPASRDRRSTQTIDVQMKDKRMTVIARKKGI